MGDVERIITDVRPAKWEGTRMICNRCGKQRSELSGFPLLPPDADGWCKLVMLCRKCAKAWKR